MTDPSAANLYRILGKIEPGQCIIIADEADRLHADKDMLSILKEVGKVSKIKLSYLYFSYCFKIRIAEEPMRAILYPILYKKVPFDLQKIRNLGRDGGFATQAWDEIDLQSIIVY